MRGDRRDRDRRDDGDPQAADDRGNGERELDAHEHLRARQSHPARRFDHVVGGAAEAGDDVREEHHERVADERDLDRRPRDARERDEQLEEREARDRVDERRQGAERLLEAPEAVREQCERKRDREADHDRDHRQLDVLPERRAERVAPVLLHPAPAERVVAGDARVAVAEVRDDGAVVAVH